MNNVCPNCGGGFEKRPIRPKEKLKKYPASNIELLKPVNLNEFQDILNLNKDINPKLR